MFPSRAFLAGYSLAVALAALANLLPGQVMAAADQEVVAFKCDFEGSPDLKSWRNLGGKPAIRPGVWSIEEEDGKHFLRGHADAGIFGITAPLMAPIEVSHKIARVEVRVKLRKAPKTNQLLRFGLTSRTQPEGRQGRAFEMARGSDSGFQVRGYQYGSDVNGLEWSREGLLRPYSEGMAFLPDGNGGWSEWKLVFEPEKGTLSFYSSFDGEEPLLTQKGVALGGALLRSLWLNGPGYTPPELRNPDAPGYVDYDEITVSYSLTEKRK